jgi:RHS repeat-associated protein
VPETPFTATYDANNRMLTYDGQPLTYDANGNLLSRETAQGIITYTWDAQDRLIGISGPNGTASFKYDYAGRRIEKTINGTTTAFLYDGAQAIAELQGSSIGTTYLTGLQIDEVLARYSASGNRTLLTDALSSVLAQTDDTQASTTLYAYSPYGEATQVGENDNSLQYTGRENDETGLYFYRARYYDPALKRFITSDPIGLQGGVNTYSYVFNNPLRWIDPTGENPLLLGVVAVCVGGTLYLANKYLRPLLEKSAEDRLNAMDDVVAGVPGAQERMQQAGARIGAAAKAAGGTGALAMPPPGSQRGMAIGGGRAGGKIAGETYLELKEKIGECDGQCPK